MPSARPVADCLAPAARLLWPSCGDLRWLLENPGSPKILARLKPWLLEDPLPIEDPCPDGPNQIVSFGNARDFRTRLGPIQSPVT